MSSGTASAPGSSANLGPGFDVLAIAWEIRCRVRVTASSRWLIQQEGEQWTPRHGEYVLRAAQAAGAGPYLIEIDNDVPRSRGLGSSSAVATAVAAATFRADGIEPGDHELFAIVADLEGHADNAAAAVFGGLVMVDGLHLARLELASELRFIAAVPDEPLRTSEARAALPEHVNRRAAVRSLARFGFLLQGLQSGRPELLARARGDELHEAPRTALAPLTGELITAALEAGARHASWSGAGPTVLAVTTEAEAGQVEAALHVALGDLGHTRRLEVAATGWV
jgi:homoserine kinase